MLLFFFLVLSIFTCSRSMMAAASALVHKHFNDKSCWGSIFLNSLRGGGTSSGDNDWKDNDIVKSNVEALFEEAGIDPFAAMVGSGFLPKQIRKMVDNPSIASDLDLLRICMLQSVDQYLAERGGSDIEKEEWRQLNDDFAFELGTLCRKAGVPDPNFIMKSTSSRQGQELMEKTVARLLLSDYLCSCPYEIEAFRQSVTKNPFWKALVKCSMIHLMPAEPAFDDLLKDPFLWRQNIQEWRNFGEEMDRIEKLDTESFREKMEQDDEM